jgi:hypothetical protein
MHLTLNGCVAQHSWITHRSYYSKVGPIRFKMLMYWRVCSAFKPHRRLAPERKLLFLRELYENALWVKVAILSEKLAE